MAATTKIIIIGGGFGGVRAALKLSRLESVSVQLISDRPDFSYYPALYRYAVGRSHLEAFVPLANLLGDRPNLDLTIEAVTKVDTATGTVTTKSASHHYDHMIVATGNVTNYFGIKGLEQFSYGMKSIEEAKRLRQHLHQELLDDSKPDVNYVVVGAGPTGVELAAALGHYLDRIIRLHGIKDQRYRVDLVEAADRVTPRLPKDMSRMIKRRLKKLGVHLYLNTAVKGETAETIEFEGRRLQSRTVIWTAGVANNPLVQSPGLFKLDQHGKVEVDEHLMAAPNVYVIGDNAGTLYSGQAQTALYDADFVAANLARQIHGRKPKRYIPKQPVYVIPVGLGWAAVLWGRVRLYGGVGWLLRRAADLVAYNDIEPFGWAWRSWWADIRYEEDCPVCAQSDEA